MEQGDFEPIAGLGTSPLELTPPDDTGTDVFARFRYQARVAVPLCLACAVGDSIRSVTLEHIEDILVENIDGTWRFMQVKTRNASRGHWRLSDLTGSGGALHSLLRAHRVLGTTVPARLEAHLEGTCDPEESLIQELTQVNGTRSEDLCARVASAMSLTADEARQFLARVSIHEEPRREGIEQRNLALIVSRRGGLTDATIMALHERLTDEVSAAMEAATAGDDWLGIAIGTLDREDELHRRVDRKRLTHERLEFYRSLLQRRAMPLLGDGDEAASSPAVSDLERKLRDAGASEELVTQAKLLRASAARHEMGILASQLNTNDRRLEDLHHRLRATAIPVADMNRGRRQAARVFQTILYQLQSHPGAVDPHDLFNGDGTMLMGAVCQQSAECHTDWG